MSRPLSLSELHSRNLRMKANLQRKPPSPSRNDDSTAVKTLQASKGSEQPQSVGTTDIFNSSMTRIVELISEDVADEPIVTLGHPTSQKCLSTEDKLHIPNQRGDEDKVDPEVDETFRLCLEVIMKDGRDAPKNTKALITSPNGSLGRDPNGVLGDTKSCFNGELEDFRTRELRHQKARRVSGSSTSSSSTSKRNRGGSTKKSSSSASKTSSSSSSSSSSTSRKRSSNRHRLKNRSKSEDLCSSTPRVRSNRPKGKRRIHKPSKRLTELEIDRKKADASLESIDHGTMAQDASQIKTLNEAENVGELSKKASQTGTLKNGIKRKELILPANLPSQFSAAVTRYLELFNLSGLEQSDDDDLKEDKLVKPADESSLLSRGTCSGSPAIEDQKPNLPETSQIGKTPRVYEENPGTLKNVGVNLEVTEICKLSARAQQQSRVSKGSSDYPDCTNTAQSSNHLSQFLEVVKSDCAIYKDTDVNFFGQQNPSVQQSPASVLGQESVVLSLGEQHGGPVLQNSSPVISTPPAVNVPAPPAVNVPVPSYHVSNYKTDQMPLTSEQPYSGVPPTCAQYLPAHGWLSSATPPPQFNISGSVHTVPPPNAGTATTLHPGPARAPLSDEKNQEFQNQKVIEDRLKLKAERETIQKKIAFLQKELSRVHKELGDLMHVKHRERNGYKDPAVQELKRAYDTLHHELSVLTKESSLAAEKQSELDTIAKLFGIDTAKSRNQPSENKEVPIDIGRRQEHSRSQEKLKRERSNSQEKGSRAEHSGSHERAKKRERSRSKEKSSRRERSKSQEKASRVERSKSHERASRVERSRSRERVNKRGHHRSKEKPTKRDRLRRQRREKRSSSRERSPPPIEDTCPNTESSGVRPPKSAKRLPDSALSSAELYEYYDTGNHWCRECNTFCKTLLDFFSHMHHKKHQQTLDPYFKPWAGKTQGESTQNSTKIGSKIAVPAKGSEFLIPLSGFYCTLCDEMLGDQISCEKHVKCYIHNENYKKYIECNLLYEERRNLDRQAGLAAVIEAKRRREREMKRRLEETHREDENRNESTENNLLKSKTDQQQASCKLAPLAISPIESIKLCTANEDLSERGVEGTKGSKTQTGKAKPITIKIAKKPLPSMQAKIRPDLPAPTMVQRSSGLTNLNKPTPLNAFLSLKSGLANKLPLEKPLTNSELVIVSDMPKRLKIDGNSVPSTELSPTAQKPLIPVVYGYGVKVLKSNVGTGVAPVKKPLHGSTMLPASLLQDEKGLTSNSNNPYSRLQASVGIQDPGVSVAFISTETNQQSSIFTQTNICIGSANTTASNPETLTNSVGSESHGKRFDVYALNSQALSASNFRFDRKTELVAMEGMQQQPSEAITKIKSEVSDTLDSVLPCQEYGDIDAPEIKWDSQLQGGCISKRVPVLETNYPGVAMCPTTGLENKLTLGLTPNVLNISLQHVVHGPNQLSQDAKEGHEHLEVSQATLVPMQLDKRKDSCFTLPEQSEYVKADVFIQDDGGILDATYTDLPTVSVEEDFDDSEPEEQIGPEPKTPLTMPITEDEVVCSPARVVHIPEAIDENPESPDTSEEAAYLSD